MKKKNLAKSTRKTEELAPDLVEKKISSKIVFKGEFLNLYKDRVLASDGHHGVREYFSHPGAVAILPYLTKKTLLLERQWRYPLKRSVLEVPAGKIDLNENPENAAKRELLEETGYIAKEWCSLGLFYPVPAYSDEVIHLYFARSLELKKSQCTDRGECIKLEEMGIENFLNEIENNKIVDAKTICFGFWLNRIKYSGFKLNWQKSSDF